MRTQPPRYDSDDRKFVRGCRIENNDRLAGELIKLGESFLAYAKGKAGHKIELSLPHGRGTEDEGFYDETFDDQ